MEKIQIKPIKFIFIIILLFAGCSPSTQIQKYEKPEVSNKNKVESDTHLSEISDIPIPDNSIIDLEKTFIVGKNEDWMGRLSLINKKNIDEIYYFFFK